MSNAWKWVLWTGVFVVVMAAAVAIRLEYVHRNAGVYQLRPSAEPMLLRFEGHYYHRVGHSSTKMPGFTKHGEDLGGGYFLAPATGGTPREIQVRNLKTFYDYRLVG